MFLILYFLKKVIKFNIMNIIFKNADIVKIFIFIKNLFFYTSNLLRCFLSNKIINNVNQIEFKIFMLICIVTFDDTKLF